MKPLVSLAALAVLVSLFLPWSELPVIGSVSLYDVLKPLIDQYRTVMDTVGIQGMAQEILSALPWQVLMFLASFVLAALALVFSVLQLGPRLWAFLAGGAAGLSVLVVVMQGQSALEEAGIPVGFLKDITDRSLADLWELLPLGPKVYLGASALLLLLALFAPGQSRR